LKISEQNYENQTRNVDDGRGHIVEFYEHDGNSGDEN
jgi:hypothetical protein